MVTLMKGSGFCDGVRNAVNGAEKLYGNILEGQQVFLYGDLVNNTYVMQSFRNRGFSYIDPKSTDSINIIPEGAIAVIRAHGVSREIIDKLTAKKALIKDYTCGKVKKIHKIVEAKSFEGYKVLIIGNKEHPEVIGIIGWSSSSTQVVENEADLNGTDLSGKICVVVQTTCDVNTWENISNSILSKNPNAEIHNTLCTVIGDREESVKDIAAASDVMFVIGDSESSNSKRLLNKCSSINNNTFPITSLFELFPKPQKLPFVDSLILINPYPQCRCSWISGMFHYSWISSFCQPVTQ
jgi:4-hydroxy-3-methylbut-2-enyl diphosphate reductase